MVSALAIALIVQVSDLAGVPPAVVREAKMAVAEMLADIDVTVEWTDGTEPAGAGWNVIRLTMLKHEGGSLQSHDGAVMGAAVRTAMGSRVAWVYYERVLQESERHLVPPARLLACTMAHEIGHLVRTSPGHDTDGLMRAVWSAADFRRASRGRLRFASR